MITDLIEENKMSEYNKDNKDFEFIKEQIIEKKRKKLKKWLFPLLMTISMAILFGIIAAVTFVIAEPKLNKILHKEEEVKTPITFPTQLPENEGEGAKMTPDPQKQDRPVPTPSMDTEEEKEPDTVIVEKSIEADIDDFTSMFAEVRDVAINVNKSLINVTSIIEERDWFGNKVDRTIKTTGVVIANNDVDLLILVSLDRVEDANSIKVEFTDSFTVNAVIQDYEREINLAVIAVSLKDIPPIYLEGIEQAKLGESYSIAVGNPIISLGCPNGYQGSMDLGIVTSKGSWVSITDNKLDLFNTNIENNKYSDGIIVNLKGEVIGLITRNLKKDLNQELSTALGISKIKPIIERMSNQIPRIYFGVVAVDMTENVKTEHEVINGIYVNEVKVNSPAYDAGMKNGDIILQLEDRPVISTNSFYNFISSYRAGDKIKVKIKRTSGTSEAEMEIVVTLADKVQ